MITRKSTLIALLGHPTANFKVPMIYNPWFESKGIDAIVVPVGVPPLEYPEVLRALFRTMNVHGALVTLPHKVTTVSLVDEVTTMAKIAGACNAVLKRPDDSLLGDMFDGAGFVRGTERKGRPGAGTRALVIGSGGVGSAIAASLAAGWLRWNRLRATIDGKFIHTLTMPKSVEGYARPSSNTVRSRSACPLARSDPFAVGGVEAAQDNDGGTRPCRPVRHVPEHEETQPRRGQDLGIRERRQHGRCYLPVG